MSFIRVGRPAFQCCSQSWALVEVQTDNGCRMETLVLEVLASLDRHLRAPLIRTNDSTREYENGRLVTARRINSLFTGIKNPILQKGRHHLVADRILDGTP